MEEEEDSRPLRRRTRTPLTIDREHDTSECDLEGEYILRIYLLEYNVLLENTHVHVVRYKKQRNTHGKLEHVQLRAPLFLSIPAVVFSPC